MCCIIIVSNSMSARDEEVMDEHVRKGGFISICASKSILGRMFYRY
jgi:hypothetical protein